MEYWIVPFFWAIAGSCVGSLYLCLFLYTDGCVPGNREVWFGLAAMSENHGELQGIITLETLSTVYTLPLSDEVLLVFCKFSKHTLQLSPGWSLLGVHVNLVQGLVLQSRPVHLHKHPQDRHRQGCLLIANVVILAKARIS